MPRADGFLSELHKLMIIVRQAKFTILLNFRRAEHSDKDRSLWIPILAPLIDFSCKSKCCISDNSW